MLVCKEKAGVLTVSVSSEGRNTLLGQLDKDFSSEHSGC